MNIVTILSTSLIHFSLKGWENVLFELGIERVNYVGQAVSRRWSSADHALLVQQAYQNDGFDYHHKVLYSAFFQWGC